MEFYDDHTFVCLVSVVLFFGFPARYSRWIAQKELWPHVRVFDLMLVVCVGWFLVTILSLFISLFALLAALTVDSSSQWKPIWLGWANLLSGLIGLLFIGLLLRRHWPHKFRGSR